ncbi:MAG: bifunctional 23S rRNA (guanine(2069)-N(7))-methyltransferase RlmK/23S rRNA (guanine(2445)-N(2))-methyltransferase RlmL [Magnetococcus sp. MYC-9]
MEYSFFATTATGFEPQLAGELRALGGANVRPGHAGVAFTGSSVTAMRVCLWSRLASRLLLPIARLPASPVEALHASLAQLPWEEHLPVNATLAVDFVGTNESFRNTHFGALKVKDAVVDRFRALGKPRPSVSTERPDLRIHVRLQAERARISLDLSGEALHRRGWRVAPTSANLKESLAAALLLLAGWPTVAATGGGFADPMCGSGTLPIEAAWMAAGVAPGLQRALRGSFGFQKLPWFDQEAWPLLLAEAQEKAQQGLHHLPPILAWDMDPGSVQAARHNIAAAGLGDHIHIRQGPITQLSSSDLPPYGLLLVNPPYGVRQGEEDDLRFLYQTLGDRLRSCCAGWQRGVFTSREDLFNNLGLLRPDQDHLLYNGPLPCRLWLYAPQAPATLPAPHASTAPTNHFANRLQKNFRQLAPWAQREGIDCFRLYDADMPEYAAAIDLYGAWVHVQEYQAPKTVDPDRARHRFAELVAGINQVLGVPEERIRVKVRKPQQGAAQYEKQSHEQSLLAVTEGGLKFLVNLEEYLDSGLFLDQRLLRQRIRQLAPGRRFLNLFGYTGSATAYAIDGGAASTVLVDISHTYLAWAERNLALNGFTTGRQHQLIQADCLQWIEGQTDRFDLILLAPPTFSNSKRMRGDWDVVRDYGPLLARCRSLLAPQGILLFVTHARRFRLDPERVPADMRCTEITPQTIPRDFQRRATFHRAWQMQRLS